MTSRLADYGYIAATIVLTVYGQFILKWRLREMGELQLPVDLWERVRFLVVLAFDPAIFSGFVAAFIASLAWIAALTRFELSYAYPFTSLSFVLVLLLGGWFLGESFTWQRMVGVALIVAGTAVAARG